MRRAKGHDYVIQPVRLNAYLTLEKQIRKTGKLTNNFDFLLLEKSLIHYFLHLLKIMKTTSPFFFAFLLLFLNKDNKYINLVINSFPRATATQPRGSTLWRLGG